MRTYRATYRRGRIVPLENPKIQEGSNLIVTVLDGFTPDDTSPNPHDKMERIMHIIKAAGDAEGDVLADGDWDDMLHLREQTNCGLSRVVEV